METPCYTDVIILRFLGYGYGDALIQRIMDPRTLIYQGDHDALAFMFSTKMLEVCRIRRAHDYFTWRPKPHEVALKVKGTNDFLEKVSDFLSGKFTIDRTTWHFLVMSGFVRYYRPSDEMDVQIHAAEEDVQNHADEERSNSSVTSPLNSLIRDNSVTPEVPGPSIEINEGANPQQFDRPSQADSESEAAEAQEPNVDGRAEPDMEAGPEPSAEASPEQEDPDRESQDNDDVVLLENVTETIPQCDCAVGWSNMPSEPAPPQMAPAAPMHHAHQPVREAPYRLSDRDSAIRYRQQNMEEFNRRFEHLSNMSNIDFN